MAELSKIRKNGVDYDIKDAVARKAIEDLEIPDTYTKNEIDAIMGSYITDIDALVGGDS